MQLLRNPLDHQRRLDAGRIPAVQTDRCLVDTSLTHCLDILPVLSFKFILEEIDRLNRIKIAENDDIRVPCGDLLHRHRRPLPLQVFSNIHAARCLDHHRIDGSARRNLEITIAQVEHLRLCFAFERRLFRLKIRHDVLLKAHKLLGALLLAEHLPDDADAVLDILQRAVLQRNRWNLQLLELRDLILLIVPYDDGTWVQLAKFLHVDGEVLPDKVCCGIRHPRRKHLEHGLLIRRLRRRVHARNAVRRAVHRKGNRCPWNRYDGDALDLSRQMHFTAGRVRHDPLLLRRRCLLLSAAGKHGTKEHQHRKKAKRKTMCHDHPPIPKTSI